MPRRWLRVRLRTAKRRRRPENENARELPTTEKPAGSVSRTTTLRAVFLLRLRTVISHVARWPVNAFLGPWMLASSFGTGQGRGVRGLGLGVPAGTTPGSGLGGAG